MKFIYTFLVSLFLLSCSLMQPKSAKIVSNTLGQKEIIAITNLIGKEKIARDLYANFYGQYKINLFGNISKRKQKHIDAWKNFLRKQNIIVDENATVTETENLQNLLLSEGSENEITALKTALKIEELNLTDAYNIRIISKNYEAREISKGIECGTKNHLFVYYRALIERNGTYKNQYISSKKFSSIINGAVNSCGLQYD